MTKKKNFVYFAGIFAFFVFLILAITSCDYSYFRNKGYEPELNKNTPQTSTEKLAFLKTQDFIKELNAKLAQNNAKLYKSGGEIFSPSDLNDDFYLDDLDFTKTINNFPTGASGDLKKLLKDFQSKIASQMKSTNITDAKTKLQNFVTKNNIIVSEDSTPSSGITTSGIKDIIIFHDVGKAGVTNDGFHTTPFNANQNTTPVETSPDSQYSIIRFFPSQKIEIFSKNLESFYDKYKNQDYDYNHGNPKVRFKTTSDSISYHIIKMSCDPLKDATCKSSSVTFTLGAVLVAHGALYGAQSHALLYEHGHTFSSGMNPVNDIGYYPVSYILGHISFMHFATNAISFSDDGKTYLGPKSSLLGKKNAGKGEAAGLQPNSQAVIHSYIDLSKINGTTSNTYKNFLSYLLESHNSSNLFKWSVFFIFLADGYLPQGGYGTTVGSGVYANTGVGIDAYQGRFSWAVDESKVADRGEKYGEYDKNKVKNACYFYRSGNHHLTCFFGGHYSKTYSQIDKKTGKNQTVEGDFEASPVPGNRDTQQSGITFNNFSPLPGVILKGYYYGNMGGKFHGIVNITIENQQETAKRNMCIDFNDQISIMNIPNLYFKFNPNGESCSGGNVLTISSAKWNNIKDVAHMLD